MSHHAKMLQKKVILHNHYLGWFREAKPQLVVEEIEQKTYLLRFPLTLADYTKSTFFCRKTQTVSPDLLLSPTLFGLSGFSVFGGLTLR